MNETYSQHALPLDTMVQEYRIVGVLGAGSFGIVYIAENKYFNETVALKEFLPTDLACRPEGTRVSPLSPETEETYHFALKKFLDEARTLRELGHPISHHSIVRVRQFIEANDTAYMVMDYEEGRPLSRILDKRGTLPEEELKKILEPLLDGLERVHEANVWHRDVKPNNILIRSDGSPVLIDFGAARREVAGADRSVMSQFTPAYAALEQVYAAGLQGPWTDIYALGATLYRAVTGKKPTNAAERFLQGAAYTPVTQAVKGDYSGIFLEAINAALKLKPQDRPQSIAEWRRRFKGEYQQETVEDDDATVVQIQRATPTETISGTDLLGGIPEPIRKTPQTVKPPDDDDFENKLRIHKNLIFISIVVVLAVAAGFAGFMSGLIQWPVKSDSEMSNETRTVELPLEPTQSEKEPQPIPSQPATLDLDTMRARVREIQEEFQCANATANLSGDGSLSISGFVSSWEDLDKFRLEMSRLEGVTNFREDLVVHPWPFCEMLEMLQRHQSPGISPSLQTHLEVNNPDRRYKQGDYLVVSATVGSAFDGYLYIDYLDSDGTVVHMLPSAKRLQNDVHVGQKVVVGAEGADPRGYYSYEIEPPYGPGLLVAITSRQALFDTPPRGHIETAGEYFPALRAALEAATPDNSSEGVMTTYQFIEIYE
jgi:serine/threonine protein kinase